MINLLVSSMVGNLGVRIYRVIQYYRRNHPYLHAPNEDSNQPARLSCLTRVFVVRMKKLCILGYPNASSEESDQTARMRRLI